MTLSPRTYESLRFEYYTARLFVSQGIKGKDRTFNDLKPTYHLSFLGENLYPDNEWLHRFVYSDLERGIKMGGRTEILTVELKKLGVITGKPVERMDIKELWVVYMLKYRERVDEKTGIIQKIIGMDEGIAAADHVFQGFTESQLEALAAIAKDKFELDAREDLWEMKQAAQRKGHAEGHAAGHAEGLAEGHAEGHAEGLAEGRTEAMKETARKLKSMSIPLEQIIEVSGLSAEVIESL